MKLLFALLIGTVLLASGRVAAQQSSSAVSAVRRGRREIVGEPIEEPGLLSSVDDWFQAQTPPGDLNYACVITPNWQTVLPREGFEVKLEIGSEFPTDHDRTPLNPLALPISGRQIAGDYASFYSPGNLLELGLVFGLGAIVANSDADERFRDFFQDNISSTSSDEWSESLHLNKEFGNGVYSLPTFFLAATLPTVWGDEGINGTVGRWGNRGLRTFVVGAPPLILGQILTGGSRPGETPRGSEWQWFQDNNGVSGHAFMGAIPFLAAADLSENRWLKGICITASTLPGLSRINDDDHYASQVLLGWSLAYLSYRTVLRTDGIAGPVRLIPWQQSDSQGMGVEIRW